ncbi:mesoderm posterior protein 1-like [Erythrolamprus reginae]|uniref:mesoderm posterior protein 1-like n=1 Tax=Erythrolamprus reginae TaxID=121349 RepID=UPI00396CAC2F
MAHSTRGGYPSPALDSAWPPPSCCCLCPGEGGPGSGSASPDSSPDSSCGSPAGGRAWRAGGRARLGGGQRRSASQREKLRMRRLAQALHALRRYLPASVAPAGQSLTKIETLRLAIRYIDHLSALLGRDTPPPEWTRPAPAPGWPQDVRATAPSAMLPEEPPALPPSPAGQSLPDELLAFLEDFFPTTAAGWD